MNVTLRWCTPLVFAWLLAFGWSQGSTAAEEKPTTKEVVAILDFRDVIVPPPLRGEKLGAICAAALAEELQKQGRFETVERTRLDAALAEAKLQQAGMVAEGEAADLGKRLAAKYVVYGQVVAEIKEGAGGALGAASGLGKLLGGKTSTLSKVSKAMVHATAKVTYTVTDTATGKVVMQRTEEAEVRSEPNLENPRAGALDAMTRALRETAVAAAKDMGSIVPKLEGIVAEVDARTGTLIATLGTQQGMAPGFYVRVFRKGKEVKHPITGEVLSVQREEICLAVCTKVEEKISTLQVGEVKGGKWSPNPRRAAQVQVGDLLETIEDPVKKP